MENWTLDKQTAHQQIDWVIIGNSLRFEPYESACVLYLALNIQISDHNLQTFQGNRYYNNAQY